MSHTSLEDILKQKGAIDLLRNSQAGPNAYPGVPPEYSNWRDETLAWQRTAVLFNQSYHMADLYVEGPDAFKMLSYLAFNSFKNFKVDQAKQFIPCTPDGYVIGDVILFYLGENKFNLVGRAPTLNWVMFHAETGKWDVKVELDQRTAMRKDGVRKCYRYQVQGPNAMLVMQKAIGATPPDLKFFNMTTFTIGGKSVRALRHGMAGQPGFEMWGPWEDGPAVHEALVKAGEEFGMRLVGGRAYGSNTLDSGWVPSPLPAVYTGESLKAYREWLPATSYEATCSLGGSFYSDNIEDYYFTPWDLGYGPFVKFDHDFVGREALEKMAAAGNHRKKVTLAMHPEDMARMHGAMYQQQNRPRYMEWPLSVYSMHPYDKVTFDGKTVGVSTFVGYSANYGRVLSLAMVEPQYAEPGTEVMFVWGEEEGGSKKPTVERHVQYPVRALVSPVPYSDVARKNYAAGGWRAQAAGY